MQRLFPLSLLLVLTACSGTGGDDTFTRPENCDDGVDNNDNGLVDCDDTQFCGGLQCKGDDTHFDTDVDLPDLEIVFTAAECCDFQWQPSDCTGQSIGSFTVINRSTELDAELLTNCDYVNGASAILWQVVGSSAGRTAFITDAPIYPESEVKIEGFFNCGVGGNFTTDCRIKLENEDDLVQYDFTISGQPVGSPP